MPLTPTPPKPSRAFVRVGLHPVRSQDPELLLLSSNVTRCILLPPLPAPLTPSFACISWADDVAIFDPGFVGGVGGGVGQ